MHSFRALVAVLCAAPLAAQISLTNANVTTTVNFNATPVVYSATGDFLRADPASDPAGVLFKTCWAFRIDNQARETILNTGGTNSPVFSNMGNVGTATWANVEGWGKVSAAIVYTAVSTGTTSGALVGRMTVANISAAPISVNLFHLADIDLCGANYLTNTTTPGNDGRQAVTGQCTTELSEHYAGCPDRWEVGSYTNVPTGSGNIDLYTKLEDTAITDLRNDAVPFGPFDIRGAFQWVRTIRVGQSETFTVVIGHNERACAHSSNHYGVGIAGGNGTPNVGLSSPALINGTLAIAVSNGPATFTGSVLLGFSRVDFPVFDIHLYVGPPSTSLGITTDNMGRASRSLPIPNDPNLCGVAAYLQAFFLNDTSSTSTSPFPITNSPGLCLTVGRY